MTPDPFDGPPKPTPKPHAGNTERRHCTKCQVQWDATTLSAEDWRCFLCDEVGYRGTLPGKPPINSQG